MVLDFVRIGALTLVLSAPVSAQGPAGAAGNPVSDAVRGTWAGARRNISASATVMPEDKYGFKPVATVRTYGQLLAHLAGANYEYCAAARREKSPFSEDAFEKSATTRAAIIKVLEDSLTYCDAAYNALTDRTAVEAIDAPFGGGKGSRVAVLMGNVGHLHEHYGNLVTYLRISGLVPPSSAPQR